METRDENWSDMAMGAGNENCVNEDGEGQEQRNDSPPPFYEPPRTKSSSSLTLKGLLIAGLTLLLLIPVIFVTSLVDERTATQREVGDELSAKWASSQSVHGPALIIPYLNGVGVEKRLTILPDQLKIKGELSPEIRSRSQIFKRVFYQTAIDMDAVFSIPLSDLGVDAQALQLNKASLAFNVANLAGINGVIQASWDGIPQKIVEGNSVSHNFVQGGMSIPVELTMSSVEQEHRFTLRLPLKGSGELAFTPVGKLTKVNISSTWLTPKFLGSVLPNESVAITDQGFDAAWDIASYNRNYPQVWKDSVYSINNSMFGLALLQPIDSYAKTERSIKYALLFIALTFALYFCIEILQKRRVHPLQYVLVGLALSVFYTLLLSISEYLGFDWAYLIASIATVSLIALYTMSAFRKASIGALFAVVLSGLYGFIYLLIQLSEGALLVGSIGLFVLLAAIMYATRGVDWYGDRVTQ